MASGVAPSSEMSGRTYPRSASHVVTEFGHRMIAVMAVNVVGFKGWLAALPPPELHALCNGYVSAVHAAISAAGGYLETMLGDQIWVTFNAHIACADGPHAAAAAALQLVAPPEGRGREPHGPRPDAAASPAPADGSEREDWRGRFALCIGLAYSRLLVGTVGYDKFRNMVALGPGMAVAARLSRVHTGLRDAVVAEQPTRQRIQFKFATRPLDLLRVSAGGPAVPVYLVTGAKAEAASDEWMYQLAQQAGPADDAWEHAFETVARAKSQAAAQAALDQFLAAEPAHALAQRLKRGIATWTPQLGAVVAAASQ